MSTSSTSELLACPFCGGKPRLQTQRCAEDAEVAFVTCESCFASTDHFEDAYAPTADAIDRWNTRAATPKAGVDREVVARTLEGIILRRMHEKRIEGYTLEMSRELADALPSVLGGVDQKTTQTTKPSPSRAEDSASETGFGRGMAHAIVFVTKAAASIGDAPITHDAKLMKDTALDIRDALVDEAKRLAPPVAETNAVAPDNAGLVSGGGR